MDKRPLADRTALRRDLLYTVRANAGANGYTIADELADVRGEYVRPSTVHDLLNKFHDDGLVAKSGDRQEQAYSLTVSGQEKLRQDREWCESAR